MQRDERRRFRLGTMLAILGVAAWASTAAAAPPKRPPVEVENLRIGFSSGDKPNMFKVGSWTPIWVQVHANQAGFTGFLETVVPDDEGTPTAFRHRIEVGPGETRPFVTYARPGSRDPEFTIRLLDMRGRKAGPEASTVTIGVRIEPLQVDDTLLLKLGKPQGLELVPGLPGFTGDNTTGGPRAAGEMVAIGGIDLFGGALPGRWYGYDAASAIVLDTNDPQTMNELTTTRGPALAEWVKRGGHLVIGLGANWQAVNDTFLGPLLPCVPTGQERVPSLETLDSYAGATKQITPPGAPPVMVTKLEDVEARGGKVLAAALGLPIVVRGPVGFGRITVVALDVDQKPFADWPDRGLFWVRAADLRVRGGAANAANVVVAGRGRIYQQGVSDLASQLRRSLEQFPGVRLVPFGWVAFFIFLYILLIGPGDYFFLKKVLKRMELTWITFPAIVATVSLIAYYAAYVVKGTDLRVNQVTVVDIDQTTGMARGNAWVNVFSPQNRDYDISVIPLRVDRPAPALDPAAPPQPPVGTDVVLSWFGNPETGFGGMGQSGRLSLSGGKYAYEPIDGATSLSDVRIAIWSTKCFAARWYGPGTQVVAADLQPTGPDRLAGTVTNQLDLPLQDAILAYGKQVYLLGPIAPRATVQVELTQDRFLSGHLKSKEETYDPARVNSGQNMVINRTDLMLALMFHDSQTTAANEPSLTSRALRDLDLTGQLALGRPMLVARIDHPGAQLVLDKSARADKTDQTTLLRVILPVNRPVPAAAKAVNRPVPEAAKAKDDAKEKDGAKAPAPEPDQAERQP